MDDNPQGRQPPRQDDPSVSAVRHYLLYGLSLPERALRSGVGVVGGAVRESAALLVPQAFQNSKTYSVMVKQMLDYLVQDVGGVAATKTADEAKTENFVARKAVGNFVELAGLATFHVSPLTVLAVVSDVAYGSKTYLHELSEELKRQKLIAEESTIDHVDDLLAAVSQASSTTATAFDTPPLSVEGLRDTINQTRAAFATIDPTKVIPQAEIGRLWGEMTDLAKREEVGLFELSSAVTLHTLNQVTNVGRGALSGVRVAGMLVNRHVFGHYQQALSDIQQAGFYATLRNTSQPYMESVWRNFSHDTPSLTAELLTGRLPIKAWNWVRGLGGSNEPAAADPPDSATAEATVEHPLAEDR